MLENHVANVQLMQKLNRLKILGIIRKSEKIARPNVAKLSGLSLSSVTNLVNYLLEKNLVCETEREESSRVGRRATLLEFNATAYSFICATVTENILTTALCDLNGKVINATHTLLQNRDIAKLLRHDMKIAIGKSEPDKLLAVGIAVSAMVLDGGETIISSALKCNIINLKSELEDEFNLPVIIENLSITNAIYQTYIKPDDIGNILFIDFEGGIGAVQLSHGEVNRAFVGEIGHTTVEKDGIECVCKNKGCLEAMCSYERIAELASKYTGQELDFEHILNMMENENVKRAVGECMDYLALTIANLINILGPDKIIFNGGRYFKSQFVYNCLLEKTKKRTYANLWQKVEFDLTETKKEQILCGIAFHLCDCIFDISFKKNIIE